MKVEPLVYYTSLFNSTNKDPIFADYDVFNQNKYITSFRFDNVDPNTISGQTVWYDPFSHKIYNACYQFDANSKELIKNGAFIDVCCQLGGIIMVWVTGEKKSILLNNYNISDFDYYVLSQDGDCNNEWLAIRDKIQYEYDKYSSQTKNEIFLLSMFTRGFISKFNYRYSIIFERWDNDSQEWCENDTIEMNPEFNSIEEMLFDGTYDKSHNEKLLQYHKAGKPQKLALRWKAYKSEYSAYLWFDEVETRIAFKQFCNNYPNANMDFTIRIDTNIPFFQIILGCNGFDDALLLSESTFQLIVFKNGFEFYRSNNYNQPRGAWVW